MPQTPHGAGIRAPWAGWDAAAAPSMPEQSRRIASGATSPGLSRQFRAIGQARDRSAGCEGRSLQSRGAARSGRRAGSRRYSGSKRLRGNAASPGSAACPAPGDLALTSTRRSSVPIPELSTLTDPWKHRSVPTLQLSIPTNPMEAPLCVQPIAQHPPLTPQKPPGPSVLCPQRQLEVQGEPVLHVQGRYGGSMLKIKGNIPHPRSFEAAPFAAAPGVKNIQGSAEVPLHLQPPGMRNEMKISPRLLGRYWSRFGRGGLSSSMGAFKFGLQV